MLTFDVFLVIDQDSNLISQVRKCGDRLSYHNTSITVTYTNLNTRNVHELSHHFTTCNTQIHDTFQTCPDA